MLSQMIRAPWILRVTIVCILADEVNYCEPNDGQTSFRSWLKITGQVPQSPLLAVFAEIPDFAL